MTVSIYKLSLAGLVLLVLGLPVVGAAALLQFLFPILAFAIGIYTLTNSPTRNYLQFTLLLWMFAPFVRRLADWQSGHSTVSPIIATPLVVSMLAFLLVPMRWPRSQGPVLYSFLLYIVVILWGAAISIPSGEILPLIYALLTWIAPVGLALLILSRQDRLEQMTETLMQTLVWGSAVMAVYGIFQFVVMPPWDRDWVISSGINSMGAPLPFVIRVFSTANISGILAIILMAALLDILSRPSLARMLAAAVILPVLGLTLVRSAWGALVLGMLISLAVGHARIKFRVGLIAGAMLLIAVPVFMQTTIFEKVAERAQSIFDLESDTSFQARSELIDRLLEDIPGLATGHGIASAKLASKLSADDQAGVALDNGFLDLIYTFGVMGLVAVGLIAYWLVLLFRSMRVKDAAPGAAIISISIVAMQVFVNQLVTPTGAFLFIFMALGLCGVTRGRRKVPVGDRASAAQAMSLAHPRQ